jgi:hypothetical protein
MTLYDAIWRYMTLYDAIWRCMTLYDAVWRSLLPIPLLFMRIPIFIYAFFNLRVFLIYVEFFRYTIWAQKKDLGLYFHIFFFYSGTVLNFVFVHQTYPGADKSLAQPTSRCILFYGENISFDASLVIYIRK